MYTPRGSQSVVTMDLTTKRFAVDVNDYRSTFLFQDLNYGEHDTYYQERVIFTVSQKPDFGTGGIDWFFLNLPIFSYMTEIPLDEIAYLYLIVRVTDPEDYDLIDAIANDFTKSVNSGVRIFKAYK